MVRFTIGKQSNMNTSVAGTFQQSPDGSRTQFWTAGNVALEPNTIIVWDNFPLVPNIGYTVYSGFIVNFSIAPASDDILYWQGWQSS
jgi:hypothetical protein